MASSNCLVPVCCDVLNLENVVGPDLDHFSKIRRPNFPAGLVGRRAGGEGRWGTLSPGLE